MSVKRKKGNNGFLTYRAYNFVNKDPIIDQMRTAFQKKFGGRLNSKVLGQIEKNGGPPVGTTRNWFWGDTRRPQNATVEATIRAAGGKRQISFD